jgi:imidazole glycerol-phosphate synthase subunit HisH
VILILDYGMGNLGSIRNMLKQAGFDAEVSGALEHLRAATKIILPGVGAFDHGMKQLRDRGLIEPLQEKILAQRAPILGICLGMQLLTKRSEEGQESGLGWIDAETIRFRVPSDSRLRVPHMGWNVARPAKPSRILDKIGETPRFYFVHSYHVVCADPADVLTVTTHGVDFVSGVERGNIYGVQFHPEKSHKFGMQLLANFADLNLPC